MIAEVLSTKITPLKSKVEAAAEVDAMEEWRPQSSWRAKVYFARNNSAHLLTMCVYFMKDGWTLMPWFYHWT